MYCNVVIYIVTSQILPHTDPKSTWKAFPIYYHCSILPILSTCKCFSLFKAWFTLQPLNQLRWYLLGSQLITFSNMLAYSCKIKKYCTPISFKDPILILWTYVFAYILCSVVHPAGVQSDHLIQMDICNFRTVWIEIN